MCKYKKCFTCNKPRLLFMYKPNRMKYQLASDLGKVTECRICEFKRIIKEDWVKYNFNNEKFEIKTKLTYWQGIKHVIWEKE